MRLVSNRNPLLAAQYPWEEILQILRIDQLGNASVSGHIHGTEGLKMRKKLLPVSEKTAQVVLNQVASFFKGKLVPMMLSMRERGNLNWLTQKGTHTVLPGICTVKPMTRSLCFLIRYAQSCKQMRCLRLMVDGFRIIRYNAFHWYMHSAGKMKTWSRKAREMRLKRW